MVVVSGMAPRRGTASDCPYQELGHYIDDDGHDEQGQPYFDEGAEVKVARRLAELVGDNTGHAVARRKKRRTRICGRWRTE